MRQSAWDYARGIGIILVVYGHVLRGLSAANVVPATHWLIHSDYIIYTFHMPLFFLLAGMNVNLAKGRFISGKIRTILFPFVVWSLLQAIAQIMLSGSTNQPLHITDIPKILLYKPAGQFWFLYALFLCHVFIVMTGVSKKRVALVAAVIYCVGQLFDMGMLSTAFIYFIFYAAGLILAPQIPKILDRTTTGPWIVATFAGFLVATYAASRVGGYFAPTALPSAFLGILLVLQISRILATSGKFRIIELLGLMSMPIYVMHILSGSGTRIVLLKLGIHAIAPHMVLGILAGLVFPVVAYWVFTRLHIEKKLGLPSGRSIFGQPKDTAPISIR